MDNEIKNRILKQLSDTHQDLEHVISGLDLDLVIHPDTGWCIRDILGHIATWDRVLIRAIRDFLAGSEYIIPGISGDETDYNAEKVNELSKLPLPQLRLEWEQAREEFIDTVRQIPAEKFQTDLNFPWGDERGSISLMIEYMIEHNGEHQEEILDAINKPI